MCGIAGIISARNGAKPDEAAVRAMISPQRHRGPDAEGYYVDAQSGVALGHCRLSVIDLSAGAQPMSNEDGTVWTTFNGEIYNFCELRDRLTQMGHHFATRSDTEVIVHAYEQYGPRCVEHFRGMFALAVWDAKTRTLFLARDRMGKKPLYYHETDGRFYFASEPKAILAAIGKRPDADPVAIHHYLTWGYVPAPQSAFKGFRVLPPAHTLTWRDGKIHIERYWRLAYLPKRQESEEALCEELLARLTEAIKLRLISDVPLGAFLSGGIDSSTIVALMSGLVSEPIKTFSIGFEEQAYNELPYARQVAERYHTDHHEFIVKADAASILPDLVWHYNEPYADSSAVPTYYLAKMTRQYVTVALNGDAGDENFAGYERYVANRMAASYDRLPGGVRSGLQRGSSKLPRLGSFKSPAQRAKRFMEALADPADRRYARWIGYFTDDMKASLYTPEFQTAVAASDPIALLGQAYADAGDVDWVDRSMAADTALYLPGDLMVKVDIASMAHALEVRSPFVDHEFMEFAASLPSNLKLRGWKRKYLLKRAVRDLLPPELLTRRKMGFGIPIDQWFRRELRDMAYDTLLSSRAVGRGLFRPEQVRRLLDEHMQLRGEWQFHLWALLMLELWFERFIDGAS